MDPETRRPSAWGEPAPAINSEVEGAGERPDTEGGTDPSTTGEELDAREQGRETAGETGTGSSGWDTVAPVLVSENGSRRATPGSPRAPGSPLGTHYASVAKRRERRVLRGVGSGVALSVIAVALGVAAAATLGVIVWLIAMAIHHAAAS